MNPSSTTNSQVRRCRALYNCRADADDELSFKEGDIILITKEKTEDEDWMEGMLQNGNGKKALFPVSFVDMIDWTGLIKLVDLEALNQMLHWRPLYHIGLAWRPLKGKQVFKTSRDAHMKMIQKSSGIAEQARISAKFLQTFWSW